MPNINLEYIMIRQTEVKYTVTEERTRIAESAIVCDKCRTEEITFRNNGAIAEWSVGTNFVTVIIKTPSRDSQNGQQEEKHFCTDCWASLKGCLS